MNKTELNRTSNAEMVTISRAEYEEFQAQRKKISELESRVDLLMEALRLARHKQFGASSEKSEDTLMEQLSFLFNEAEVFSAAQKEEENVTVVAAHKRHKKHEYTLDNIPEGIETKQVEHRLEGADLICPQCGDTMTEIGKEVVRTMEIIPAQTIVREDIYYTYACKICSESADEGCETPVVKAPREKNIIPGSFATPEAIAHIMTQKFVMGAPLYRQEQEINRQGIQLSRQTMSNWILKATEDYLTPVYEQLHKELLKRDVLHADETTLQVLHEPGKAPQSESYMWLYRTSGDTDKPIVLYEYQPGRGAKHPKEFLAGYNGYLHTDGYVGYHDLGKDITVVGCWAHLRRKFDEAVKSLPKGKAKGSSASQGLTYCNLLFGIEQEIADKTAKERYKERLKQAKPVLDAMFAWANSRTAAPKSALGKALHYLKEQWPYLTNYLKDGRLEISNNRAERSIKPFVIDRKNFLFANTPKGATGSAVMFSLIQTAIENGLDPYKYLTWLLKQAKDADLSRNEIIQSLLPWNAFADCRVK
jgi:transposase